MEYSGTGSPIDVLCNQAININIYIYIYIWLLTIRALLGPQAVGVTRIDGRRRVRWVVVKPWHLALGQE